MKDNGLIARHFAQQLDEAIDERLLTFNHEIWRVCSNCGAYLDLRMNDTCEDCGHKYEDE